MRFISNRRVVAVVVAASCVAVPVSASADSLQSTYRSDAAQSGQRAAYPPSGFKGGDMAQSERVTGRPPTTIEVIRPERTIVRNSNDAFPLVLSASALLLVLAGIGVTLVRGTVPRLRRSH